MGKETRTKLDSTHCYGTDHPLIGVPCLWKDNPAIPYGSYDLNMDSGEKDTRLAILFYAPDEPAEGKQVFVKAMSGVRPDNPSLVVLNPLDPRYRYVSHIILAWLADHREGTFKK